MAETPPRLITDRYLLVELIGQGEMGRVWKAQDKLLERVVAIKEIVPPPGLTDEARQALGNHSLREARAIARLSHANAVRVYDVLSTDGNTWMVMEYVASRSLQQVITTDGPVPPLLAAKIGLSVLDALRAAHLAGIMHRDVKPSNVLVSEDEQIVLVGFGLATQVDEVEATSTNMTIDSPAYISPERAISDTVGPEGDLWSLGATLFAAVEGHAPYARRSSLMTLAALATEPPPVAEHAGPLAPALEGLLRKNPAERVDIGTAERLLRQALQPQAPGSTDGERPAAGRPDDEPAASRPMPVPSLVTPASESAISSDTRWWKGEPSVHTSTTGRFADYASHGEAAWTEHAAPQTARAEASRAETTTQAVPASQPARVETAAQAPHAATDATPMAVPAANRVRVSRRGDVLKWAVSIDARRKAPLIGALAGLILLGVSIVVPLAKGQAGGDDVSAAPTSTTTGEGSASGLPLQPLTWTSYGDSDGFSLPVPNGWPLTRHEGRIEFREPGGSRLLVVTSTNAPKPDLLTDLTAQEKARPADGQYRSYQRIGFTPANYFLRAADWDWTYSGDGDQLMHARQRSFATATEQGYTILWAAPAAAWGNEEDAFRRITAGFQPAPAPSTEGDTTSTDKPNTPPPTNTAPTLESYQIIAVESGRCLEAGNVNSSTPVRLQVWDCSESRRKSQRWTLPSDGTVRLAGKCMEVADNSSANGAAIRLAACTSGPAQQFVINGEQQLVNRTNGKCLNIMGTANGSRLQLGTCDNGAIRQKWQRA
ncbi:ricin-type beta-trefoil lectin domain protein [Micromonospora sp. NPDC050417]|uniref:protein kinase domain-containing protein n=1 Tax=Micromonospora sp. NPDC050417 TaxID=3364280 RepID=UPI0037AC710A